MVRAAEKAMAQSQEAYERSETPQNPGEVVMPPKPTLVRTSSPEEMERVLKDLQGC